MTVASQATANKQITKITELIEGCSYGGFSMISDGSVQNAESGIDIRYTRNCKINDVYAEHPGSGIVISGYCTNLTGRNWHVAKCKSQGGLSAKGRGFVIWNGRNITVDGVTVEDFESTVCFIESYSDGVVIDGLDIRNNAATKTSNSVLYIVQSSRTLFRNVVYSGRTATQTILDNGATPDYSKVENVSFRCDMFALRQIPLSKFGGLVKHLPSTGPEQFDFAQVEEHTVDVTLVDSLYADLFFPDGILLSSDIYVSPGVTAGGGAGQIEIYQGRTGNNGSTQAFTAGSLVRRQHNAGTDYPTDSQPSKALKYLIPAGASGLTGQGKHVVIRARTVKPLLSTTVANEPGSEQYQRFLPSRAV